MMLTQSTLRVLALSLSVPILQAAQGPDFSGEWTPDIQRSMATLEPHGAASWPGDGNYAGLRISQGTSALTVRLTTAAGQVIETNVYRLDGAPSALSYGMTAVAKWDGDKLVVDTKESPTKTSRMLWYLDGDNLVREINVPAVGGTPDTNHRKWYYNRVKLGR